MDIPGGWSQIPTEGGELANQWAQSQLGAVKANEAYQEEPTAIATSKAALGQEQTKLASSQIDLQNKQQAQPITALQTWEARLAQGAGAIDPSDPKASQRWSTFIQKEISDGNPVAEQWQDYSPSAQSRLVSAYSAATPMAQQSALGASPFQSALGSPTGYGPGQTPPGGAPTAPVDYNSHFASLPPAQLQALGTKLEGIKQGITAVQNSPNPVATFNSIATQLGHPEWVTNDPREVQQHLQMLAQQVVPAAQAYEAYTTNGSVGLPAPQVAPKMENVGGNLVSTNPTAPGVVTPAYVPDKWAPVPYSVGPGGGSQIVDKSTGDSKELPGSIQARGGAGTLDAQLGAIRKAYPGLTDEQILDKRSAMFGTSGSAKGQSAVVMGETADRLAQQDVSNGVIPAAQQAQQAAMYRQQLSAMSATPGTAGAGPTATPGGGAAAIPATQPGVDAKGNPTYSQAQSLAAQQFRGSKAKVGQPTNPWMPVTQAQWAKIPKGDVFLDPTGTLATK